MHRINLMILIKLLYLHNLTQYSLGEGEQGGVSGRPVAALHS